jgi:hypothetical protein
MGVKRVVTGTTGTCPNRAKRGSDVTVAAETP